jgi:hypothetical protein
MDPLKPSGLAPGQGTRRINSAPVSSPTDGKNAPANIPVSLTNKALPEPPANELAAANLDGERKNEEKKRAVEIEESNVLGSSSIAEEPGEIEVAPAQSLEDRVKQLEDDLETQNQEAHHYYEIAQKYEQEAKQFENKWRGTAKELLRLRQTGSGLEKVDDDVILKDWIHIRYLVRAFANKYFTVPRTSHMSLSRKPDAYKYLTDNPKHYMQSRQLRPVLIQAYLLSNLFTQKGGACQLWAGSNAEMFRAMSRSLQPTENMHLVHKLVKDDKVPATEMQTFMTWRSSTATLLAQKTPRQEVGARVESIATSLYQHIYPYAALKADTLYPELLEITAQTVEFDKMMHQSRAFLSMELLYVPDSTTGKDITYGYKVVGEVESEAGFEQVNSSQTVELTVAPALVKIGNSDGGGYEIRSILAKGTVVSKETRSSMEKGR